MNIKVLDTTLRDGEQTPGVSLTSLEKLRIATKLDEIGVEYIEAGSAITSEGEREAIKFLLPICMDSAGRLYLPITEALATELMNWDFGDE